MRTSDRHCSALLVACTTIFLVVPAARSQAPESAPPEPIFRFETDGFWLNLHHFLYVLGRAESGASDSGRDAVAKAPADQQRGLEGLPAAEREAWRAAVSTYATGASQLDAVFDEELVAATRALAALPAEAGDLEGVELDPAWRRALEQAAPLYRRLWWPEHRDANRAWVVSMQPLIAEHGAEILAFVTRAYGLPWPEGGYPIQLSGYCNWAGAYSTSGRLLVVSSLDEAIRGSTEGLEILFHEAMHQWDDAQFQMLRAAAIAHGVRFPAGLSHAMIFFTAGEAARTAIPGHTTYADKYGIWQRRSGAFLPMLERAWRPYLHGTRHRAEALSLLMREFVDP